jgi:hypothetical protein
MTRDQRDVFIQVIGIPPEKMMVIENSNKATSLATIPVLINTADQER